MLINPASRYAHTAAREGTSSIDCHNALKVKTPKQTIRKYAVLTATITYGAESSAGCIDTSANNVAWNNMFTGTKKASQKNLCTSPEVRRNRRASGARSDLPISAAVTVLGPHT